MPPRWCAEGILQPRAVQATGPTNEDPRRATTAGPRVKHASDELRGCVELDRQHPPVPRALMALFARPPGQESRAPIQIEPPMNEPVMHGYIESNDPDQRLDTRAITVREYWRDV